MRYMNNDFFDYFTVSFDKRESTMRDQWFPLGTFAAEVLNLGVSVAFPPIDLGVRELREAFTIFLSSRSPSSAAVAREKMNDLWVALGELPVYRHLYQGNASAIYLIGHLRDHPEQMDEIATQGSELNTVYTRWLEKLEGLTGSLRRFQKHVGWMLEEFFEKLPSRLPESYAGAYALFQRLTTEEIRIREEEGERSEVEQLPFDFPTQLSFVPVYSFSFGKMVLAERMLFEDLASFLYVDLYKGMTAGNIPRRCRNCGRYFLAVGGYDTIYCSNVAPGEKKKTCRQVGAHRTEKIKNDSSPIQKEYKRAYNRLKARKQRGTLSVDEWNRKVAEAQRLRDEALEGKMDVVALRMWLEGL